MGRSDFVSASLSPDLYVKNGPSGQVLVNSDIGNAIKALMERCGAENIGLSPNATLGTNTIWIMFGGL
jgi:hypothetical protein